mgnify:CR=1 FL=1
MTIQEILKAQDGQITKIAFHKCESTLDWKPWKAAELTFDAIMCHLEKLPELIALEEEDEYLPNSVLDAIYDYSDSKVALFAELLNMTKEDLGIGL